MSWRAALEATWPPRDKWRDGPFMLRDGAGGGKRVSAASLETDTLPSQAELDTAEQAMRDMRQAPLFSLTPEQFLFDALLADRGYAKVDATRLYTAPVSSLTEVPVPRVTVFEIWEPLAIMEDLWAAGGIGPARLAVMHRVAGAKTALFGRIDSQPAGAGFVAQHETTAMLHALEIDPTHRRKGLARWMIIAAAHWAKSKGCTELSLLVTEANDPANALYQSMGFHPSPGYHYRVLQET